MSSILRLLPALLGAAIIGPISAMAPAIPPAAESPPPKAFFEALRAADLRLATIGYRLTSANVALCDRRQPQLGMPIHALNQYGTDARPNAMAVFGFETLVAVPAITAVLATPRMSPGIGCSFSAGQATGSVASRAAMTACTGMRPLATSWPPARRRATANGAAHRFS